MSIPLGRAQRASLSVLLFAAVLSPVMGEAIGWATYPAATATAAVVVAIVLATVMLRASAYRTVIRAAFVAVTLVVAIGLAAVLQAQTNTFYTSTALFGGMVLLLSLHVAAVAMRHIVLRDDDILHHHSVAAPTLEHMVIAGVERLPPNEIRVVRAGRAALEPEPASGRWRGDPLVALSDTLASGAAWLLLLFWILVALEHRHVASGCVLLAGALLLGRCLVLLPGVLARGDASVGLRDR